MNEVFEDPMIAFDGNIKMQLHGQFSFKTNDNWLEVFDMSAHPPELQARVNTNKILFIGLRPIKETRE